MTETTVSTIDARAKRPAAPLESQPLALQSMFWRPQYLEPSAWMEHLPFAFWLMEAQRPRTFVELGSHHGTSYFAFCQAADSLGLDARCFAVDTWKGDEHAGFYDERVFNKVRAYNDAHYSGFSSLVRSTFDEATQHFSDGTVDLLHIDGLHTFDAVSHDFDTWLPKLSRRAVVVLHDINVRERGFGVFRLFEKLKETYPCFEFVHGHGLGVVGVGSEQTPLLARLFESDRSGDAAAPIRDAFSRLGRACADAFAIKQQRDRALEIDEQLFRRNNEIAVLAEKLAKAEASVEARFKETASLTGMLLELEHARAANQATIVARERSIRELEASLKQARAEHAAEHAAALRQSATHEQQARAAQAAHAKAIAQLERKSRSELLGKDWELAQANAAIIALEQEHARLRQEHARILASTSWKLTAPLRRMRTSSIPAPLEAPAASPERELLRASDLFDAHWYRQHYADVAASGIDPVDHYLEHGASEGRDPGPQFSTSAYLQAYPRIRESGINPLVHYLIHGFSEGRTSHPAEPGQE